MKAFNFDGREFISVSLCRVLLLAPLRNHAEHFQPALLFLPLLTGGLSPFPAPGTRGRRGVQRAGAAGGGSSCAQRGGSLFELRSLPCASAYLSPRPLSGIPVLKGEPLNADALSAKLALFQHLVWGDAHFNAVP